MPATGGGAIPALRQKKRRHDMHKTAALLLSASLLCTPAPAPADPLAEIDSLILSNMQILSGWEDGAPQATLDRAPEPAQRPDLLAEAPRRVYGPDGSRFRISIPQGWHAEAISGGVRSTAGNGRSALTAAILHAGGKTAGQLARDAARNTGLRFSSQDEDGTCFLSGKTDGMRTIATSSVEDGKWLFMALQGEDEETLAKILDSLEQAG